MPVTTTCSRAAENSHYLEVMQWAQNIECKWDSDTCAYGYERMDVSGTRIHELTQLCSAVWMCCSGHETMDAHGIGELV